MKVVRSLENDLILIISLTTDLSLIMLQVAIYKSQQPYKE